MRDRAMRMETNRPQYGPMMTVSGVKSYGNDEYNVSGTLRSNKERHSAFVWIDPIDSY